MVDSHTTLVLAALAFGLLPLLIWWLAPADEPDAATAWWQLGSLAAATGLLLLGQRAWLPIWLGNHVANTSLLVALMLWTQSLWVQLGRGWRSQAVAWACLAALLYYSATFLFVATPHRIALNRGLMGGMALYIAFLAWQLSRRERSQNALAISACYVLLGTGLWVTVWMLHGLPLRFTERGVLAQIPASPALLTLMTAMVGNFRYLGLMLERSTRRKAKAVRSLAMADENARLDAELQLMDRNRRLVLAAGSLAHELNQPLTAALTQTQLAQRLAEAPHPPAEALAGLLGKAAQSIWRTSDILDRIRGAAHSQEPVLLPLDLREVAGTACELVRTDLREQGLELHTHLGEQPLPCAGDEVLLSQVLVNLLRNAAQAMAGTAGRVVQVRAVREQGMARLVVRDQGPGVPAAVLQHWGEPFTGQREEGLGLGLAISQAILTQHGGQLALRNLPQGGAEAELALPMHAKAGA